MEQRVETVSPMAVLGFDAGTEDRAFAYGRQLLYERDCHEPYVEKKRIADTMSSLSEQSAFEAFSRHDLETMFSIGA